MIEAQQRLIETDRSGRHLVNFRGDKAGAAARRIVKRKLAAQQEQAPEPEADAAA